MQIMVNITEKIGYYLLDIFCEIKYAKTILLKLS
jgi:hypothetical protein